MASEVRIPAKRPNDKESRRTCTPRLPRSCAPRKDGNRRGADAPTPAGRERRANCAKQSQFAAGLSCKTKPIAGNASERQLVLRERVRRKRSVDAPGKTKPIWQWAVVQNKANFGWGRVRP